MWPFLLRRLLSVSCLWLFLCVEVGAQQLFPARQGEKQRYAAYIEMPKAYVSGVCMMLHDSTAVKGCVFNEFGLSAIDFSYLPAKDKVVLHHVAGAMDKWYIRRLLRRDLRELVHRLQQGNTTYYNEKYHITYQFTPINNEKTENNGTEE